MGGRVTIESTLPGLATWARVRDYRTHQIQTMANVDVYLGSQLTVQDILDYGCDHAVIATGARWTREILGTDGDPAPGFDGDAVYTPHDILAGAGLDDPVVIYDFDHFTTGEAASPISCGGAAMTSPS